MQVSILYGNKISLVIQLYKEDYNDNQKINYITNIKLL